MERANWVLSEEMISACQVIAVITDNILLLYTLCSFSISFARWSLKILLHGFLSFFDTSQTLRHSSGSLPNLQGFHPFPNGPKGMQMHLTGSAYTDKKFYSICVLHKLKEIY